jgi:hypothetical protein
MTGVKLLHLFFLVICSVSASKVSAQIFPAKYEVGLTGGAFIYQGDLAPRVWGSIKTTRPGFGGYAGRILSPAVAVRFAFNIGTLKGDETKFDMPEFRKYRAFKFKGTVREFSLQLKLNMESLTPFTLQWKPYVFAGLGVAYINTAADYSEFEAGYFGANSSTINGLAVDITKPAKKQKPVIPIGLGIRRYLTEDLSLNVEGSYRLTNTDYIDGFSESANPKMNDHYLVATVGLSYEFGRKSRYACPVVKN